jgi:succinoglycan biosynthesis protein ExoL
MTHPHASGAAAAHVLLLVPDIGETSSIKRAEQFLARGLSVTMLGFRRKRYHRDFEPSWPFISLGQTHDGRYGHRAAALVRALRIVAAQPERFAGVSVIYARNIDQLVLAILLRALIRRRVPIVYEVLDIPAVFVGRGVAARLLRRIERLGLGRVDLLVVSSPAFHARYFASMQGYAGDWLLLENKLHRAPLYAVTRDRNPPRTSPYRWRVGYFGLIRGEATFDLMCRLAARFADTVEFRFRGVLTTVGEARFRAALARHPNMVFAGDYENPRDLAEIYNEVDFAWAIDLEHADHNSRWLLPCRFYEAGYFGVPCLAVRGFAFGDLVDSLGAGWSFAEPLEERLSAFFASVTPEEVAAKRRRLRELPRETFIAGAEVDALCGRYGGALSPPRKHAASSS